MDWVNHSLSNLFLKKSVIVYTLHKSGSTLFSRLLFPNCFGLSHSDVDSNIYNTHVISTALDNQSDHAHHIHTVPGYAQLVNSELTTS